MKKISKKTVSLLLSIVMILTALPFAEVTAFAEDDTHISGDFEYKMLNDGTVEITGYTGSATTLNIPSILNGYTVISIGDNAFRGCGSLASFTIPNSVISIGDCAFSFCDSLTSITVDTNNKTYSSQDGVLFNKDKTELIQYPIGNTRTSYTIPNGVTIISDSAFASCNYLTNVTVPNSVTSIGDEAFVVCFNLTNITIGKGVTSIGERAFEYCWGLTSITIPDSVTSIGNDAFRFCYSLTSVTIPDSVTSIGEGAFYSCESLTSIIIGNGITSIGDYTFDGCTSLTSITIPDSVTSIGTDAFYECKSLTSITIPDSVTSIGDMAFKNCNSLTNITIPESVISIGFGAFGRCDSLTSVTIPDSVVSIGNGAFDGVGLTSITVDKNNEFYSSQDGVLFNKDKTELTQYPIGNARTSYTIPNSVTSICNGAFSNCVNLISVIISDSVTSIGDYAFGYCDNLNDIYILNQECYISYDYYSDGNIPLSTTIHGYIGSTAEEYANEHGNKFIAIDENAIPKAIGDINGDGKITTVDAKWILKNIAGSKEFSDEQIKAADLNGDGKISVVDVKWVLQIIAGMRDAETLEPVKK